LLDLRLLGQVAEEEYAAKREELLLAQAKTREALSAFELPTSDPEAAVKWFIQACNGIEEAFEGGTDDEIRQLLRIVGSNYQLKAGVVNFEPVEPFTLAAQARNRPNWLAKQSDILTLVQAYSRLT